MKRKYLSIISLLLILCCCLSVQAFATDAVPSEPVDPIDPAEPFVDIAFYNCGLIINSSGKASCSSFAQTAHSNYNIYINIALYRYKDGYWQNYAGPWSGSGTQFAYVDKDYYVVPGYYYCVGSAVTVQTSTGSFVESATLYSPVKYY